MKTSRADRSTQPSTRSHSCQSTQSFLPILPSQSFHTNRARQYFHDIQISPARQSTQSRNPSQPSQRRKDGDPFHSSHPGKSSRASHSIISVQPRKPTHSSQPRHRVFDAAQEGYSIDWIPTRRGRKWPYRIGNRGYQLSGIS